MSIKGDYKTKICDGIGDRDSPKHMLVGMCGGRLGCIQTGVPFTRDGSGRLLIRVLKELGYTSSFERDEKPEYHNVYVTNLVKGVILNECGNNRVPNETEIEYWLPSFLNEVNFVKPKHTVAIGSVVFSTLLRVDSGDIHPPLLSVRHPSYYLRNGALGKANQAWKDMLEEYKNILGYNEKTI